ncbi:hypothetical protein MishRS11D_27030 [Methylomagnum ishizawai]|nr:hypothetical protein MishRS11D_27030 [Methylomagnum ishizawai]
METLRLYLNSLPKEQQESYALRAGTTLGYLRRAMAPSGVQRLGADLCIALEQESGGKVRVEELRPDLMERWIYFRGTKAA